MLTGKRRPNTSGIMTGRRRNIPLVKVPNEGDKANRLTINQSPSSLIHDDSPPIKVELGQTHQIDAFNRKESIVQSIWKKNELLMSNNPGLTALARTNPTSSQNALVIPSTAG